METQKAAGTLCDADRHLLSPTALRILKARPLLLTWRCRSNRYHHNKERLS